LLPQRSESVLEIGAGSGFVSACLRALAARVRTLETFAELAESARRNLATLGMGDVEVVDADAFNGEQPARYDVIAVPGALLVYAARLERLLPGGGRVFVVAGAAPAMEARLIRRTADAAWSTQSLFETVIDPLVNAARPPQFTF